MPFDVLQARTVGDAPNPLYPLPGHTPNSFVLEPRDGETVAYDAVGAIVIGKVGGQSTELGRVEKIKATITLTEKRFVFACTSFQSSGGWMGGGVGGVLVAAAANAASKAIANRETRGYTLVGQVRWNWLRGVAAQNKRWGREQNHFKLIFTDPTVRGLSTLSVFPPDRQAAEDIGLEIVRRAARAKALEVEGDARLELEAYAANPPVKTLDSGTGRQWILPSA